MFKKLLIANRGEIAIRVARTCKRMGIQTVGIYSETDKKALHLDYCDEVYSLGSGTLADTYLNIPKIVSIIKKSKANAVHPGYGFLSERAEFAKAVKKAKAKFVGPDAKNIEIMGDKLRSKEFMKKLGVPMLPSSPGGVKDLASAKKAVQKIGFPILLKASAGGGGKGMRIVRKMAELEPALEGAIREAKSYFGDGTVYLEKFLENPHHVEVQVLGDGKGGGGHVFDRECSIQRRHQKLVEESPAPLLTRKPKAKEKILKLANKVVSKMKYLNAGTLEFLADDKGNFYFLEMNTRLQVEHPVTEWVSGLDLVELQIRVANGMKLKKGALCAKTSGYSIEVRLYAETPFEYLPTGGKVEDVILPSGPFTRVDASIYRNYDFPLEYDPTLLKLSVWGNTREQAVDRLKAAIDELRILGVGSNQGLFWAISREKDFKEGKYGTNYLSKNGKKLRAAFDAEMKRLLPEIAMGAVEGLRRPKVLGLDEANPTIWEQTSRVHQIRSEEL